MTELSYRCNCVKDKESCISFLKKSGFWNDINVMPFGSLSKKIIIEIDEEEADDFLSKARYKGFRFNEEA